jgi:polar amino acid transport system substrate-binding protein
LRYIILLAVVLGGLGFLLPSVAQEAPMRFNTIERAPFAFSDKGVPAGFSIDLMNLLAAQLGRSVDYTFSDTFPEMLEAVALDQVDGAVANISITSAREAVLDFSQPIFESGLQIMVSGEASGNGVWRAVFNMDLLIAVLVAFAIVFLLGLLMWVFERKKQPYFDRSAKDALFPSFWWALNLVVNGGFEERQPHSFMGRFLAVLMVISSLFIVSIFVANITATLTVEAITGSIDSLDDLDGRRVATTVGSTASSFLEGRGIAHRAYPSLAALLEGFESQEIEAVVFDGPILAHYVSHDGLGQARMLDRVYRSENYGIALPQGSAEREALNRALPDLKESGVYQDLVMKWFGTVDR